MSYNTHPSTLLKPEWVDIIRNSAARAEQKEQLQFEQLQLIYEQQWFKMAIPKHYGGLEMSLPSLVRLEEALAWADGSLGWVVTLCAGAGWFGGFLDPAVALEVFAGHRVCLAGSGAATGTAEQTENGYTINGKWQYASGVLHATHFTANCIITQNGKAQLDKDGNQLIVPFIIGRKDVEYHSSWKYIGMMGTGSHAFSVADLYVPAERSFRIDPEAALISSDLYVFPFLQLAEATLAANLSGMAVHFIDLCEPLFRDRISQKKLTGGQAAILRDVIHTSRFSLQNSRDQFYKAVDKSFNTFKSQEGRGDLQHVSETSRTLAANARAIVDQLYPYCGLIAAAPDTELNRVWRDLHTASQHSLLTFPE